MWFEGPTGITTLASYTVMDSPGRSITATTNSYNSGLFLFSLYGDINGCGTYSGDSTANTEMYVPPTFHTVSGARDILADRSPCGFSSQELASDLSARLPIACG